MTRQLAALLVAVAIGTLAMYAPPSGAQGKASAGFEPALAGTGFPAAAVLPLHHDAAIGLIQGSLPLSRAEAEAIVCRPEFTWDCGTMLAIAWRESRLQPEAVNWDCNPREPYMWVCYGLFQHILPAGVDGSWLFDPWFNTELAHEKYLHGGLKHWKSPQESW